MDDLEDIAAAYAVEPRMPAVATAIARRLDLPRDSHTIGAIFAVLDMILESPYGLDPVAETGPLPARAAGTVRDSVARFGTFSGSLTMPVDDFIGAVLGDVGSALKGAKRWSEGRRKSAGDLHEPSDLSFDCERGDHSGCSHVPYHAAVALLRRDPLPEHEPWWIDDTGGEMALCACRCHAECELTASEDPSEWLERCSCNGALEVRRDWLRRRGQPSSRGAMLAGEVAKAGRLYLARRSAASRGRGKGAAEVAAIVDDEWCRQGLDPPVGLRRVVEIDRVLHPPSRIEQMGATAKVVRDLATLPARFVSLLREAEASSGRGDGALPGSLRVWSSPGYEVASGGDHIELAVGDDVQARLGGLSTANFMVPSLLRQLRLELRPGSHGEVELYCRPPGETDELRVASLPPEQAAWFGPAMAAAGRVGQPCTCVATRFQTRDRRWRLVIRRPLARDEDGERADGTID